MPNNRRILFLTPAAERSGSNIFLLRFLRWVAANTDIPFDILYEREGELEEEFKELANSVRYKRSKEGCGIVRRGLIRLEDRSGLRDWGLKRVLGRRNYGLIFSNTVANHMTLPLFSHSGIPVITCCHELECAIRLTGIKGFEQTRDVTTHFIAVSNAVRDQLTGIQGVPYEQISVIHGFLPLDRLDTRLVKKKNEIKEEIGFPADSFLVGASGTLDWRKAPEMFIRIADNIIKGNRDLPIYFVWIGGASESDNAFYCAKYDVAKMELEERVRFLGHTSDPFPYFAALDVFAMVSREDPFPLVCLESAAFSVPIICFDNAGGTPEFVENDCGFVVPYMDTNAFAEKIVEFCDNPELRTKMGTNAATKVRAKHDIEIGAPRIVEKIEEFRLK